MLGVEGFERFEQGVEIRAVRRFRAFFAVDRNQPACGAIFAGIGVIGSWPGSNELPFRSKPAYASKRCQFVGAAAPAAGCPAQYPVFDQFVDVA